MAKQKGTKRQKTAGEKLAQRNRTERNKLFQARAKNRRKEQHAKQVKPLITARYIRRHTETKAKG